MVVKQRETPEIFLRGIDKVIRQDLGKHKELLTQTKAELDSFREAVLHESGRKRHYFRQIGKGKYNDEALEAAVKDIRINIRHLSDKVKLSEDKMEHHELIIATLTGQLEDYERQKARADSN